MSVPFLFAERALSAGESYIFDEGTARHLHVLRMRPGDAVVLTDGKGMRMDAAMNRVDKKRCEADILRVRPMAAPPWHIAIGVSFTKNISRIEWFLEKATEIGISEIYPIVCRRTEKIHYKFPRFRQILISAMLQSQQYHLPLLQEPLPVERLIGENAYGARYIAHCEAEEKAWLQDALVKGKSSLLLVGPEGDFTREEIASAKKHDFIPVSLGSNRLRTETAAVVACTLLHTAFL